MPTDVWACNISMVGEKCHHLKPYPESWRILMIHRVSTRTVLFALHPSWQITVIWRYLSDHKNGKNHEILALHLKRIGASFTFFLQGTVLNLTKYVSMHFDVSIGKIKTLKPFISISSNLVILLILMPRFQILHFPGPEMARLLKNCS